MMDLGPERPGGHASETREWADHGRTAASDHELSNRRFLILLAIIVVALVMFFVLR